MDRHRWQQIQDAYAGLEGLPAAEREQRLSQIDPALAGEVRQLFADVELEEQAQERLVQRSLPQPEPEMPGLQIFKLLGSGGAGAVYRAVRTVRGARQDVAVKVLHAHRAGPEDLLRFRRECDMMASLYHPGVVHFLDAGECADGRPYLVMELAEGRPIGEYCDGLRLPVEQRIRLLLDVCEAVSAAHAQLVVHLDLKPANILVNAAGQAKLLDLGTAKLLDPIGESTATHQLTPRYASPEQLRAEPASVASDVYSLGLVLYELLSGGWPFEVRDSIVGFADRAAGSARLRPLPAACSGDAAEKSGTSFARLQAALRGDLAAICEKALAHDIRGRYRSVADLAADLRRHLAGQPVLAHPPGFAYHARKFVSRHWLPLLLGTLFAGGLVGAAVYSQVEARRANAALEEAEATTFGLANVLTPRGPVRDITLSELLRQAQEDVPRQFGASPAVGADFEIALLEGFLSLGDLQRARKGVDAAAAFAKASGDVSRQAIASASSAWVSYSESRPEDAWRQASEAYASWRANRGAFPPGRARATLTRAGQAMLYVKPFDPAAGKIFQELLSLSPAGDPRTAYYRLTALEGAANSLIHSANSYAAATPMLEEAVTLVRRVAKAPHPQLLQALGLAYRLQGRYAEDEACQREAAAAATKDAGPSSVLSANYRAVWASSLAGVGQAEQGLQIAKDSLADYRRTYPLRGTNLLSTPLSAAMLNACMMKRFKECEAYAREGLETLGPKPAPKDARLANANGMLGLALAGQGRDAEAKPLIEQALAAFAEQKRTPLYEPLLKAALARMR